MTRGAASLRAVTRVLRDPPRRTPNGEQCEMCSAPMGPGHSHVVDLDTRELQCTCRPCALLFTQTGAGSGRYRAVPERYASFPDFSLSQGQWDSLSIPVGMAFFFHNSQLGRIAAFYPSPAGATESTLNLDAWTDVVAANPGLVSLEPDVEAILVRSEPRSEGRFECFLVPIDACYELVGHMRALWQGFDGGREARERIDSFFADVAKRSRPLRTRTAAP